jgi:hypothetical protein
MFFLPENLTSSSLVHQPNQVFGQRKNTIRVNLELIRRPPLPFVTEGGLIRVGIKKPTQKNPPKKTQKNPPKKTTKTVFFGFFKFLIFYGNNTNFSLSNRFFMNK